MVRLHRFPFRFPSVFISLFFAAVLFVLCLHLSQIVFQSIEGLLPELTIGIEPIGSRFESLSFSRHGRHCASRPRSISPARSSTLRCLETAGRLILKGFASSVTDLSPRDSLPRMARRVGSAKAANVVLSLSVVIVIYQLVI